MGALEKGQIPSLENKQDANSLVDFILFTQKSVILHLSPELTKENISFPQFFLLTYLTSEEYVTMTDIAKKMWHSTAAATGLVDKLEKMGLVERLHMKEDRRKIMVQITKKGDEFVTKKRETISKRLQEILQES